MIPTPTPAKPPCSRCGTPVVVSHIGKPPWWRFPPKIPIPEIWTLWCTACGHRERFSEKPPGVD